MVCGPRLVAILGLSLLAQAAAAAPRGAAVITRSGCVPTIRTVAMPKDTNAAGDIFGGWLLSQMDLAAGNVGALRARGRCATVAVNQMSFEKPVRVGDEVTLHTELVRVGSTSMTVKVEAWRADRKGGERDKVTEGLFTVVAVDKRGRPRLLPEAQRASSLLGRLGQSLRAIPRHLAHAFTRFTRGRQRARMDRTAADLQGSEPRIRTIAMPADANAAGDIFAGWLLSQMDLAGASAAVARAQGRVTTRAIESMSFEKPVKIGDEVSLHAQVESVGRTSMKVRVQAWGRPRAEQQAVKVTEGLFTFVALDSDGRPRPVAVP